ncbi:UNVERIFIED_CONTAM: hypothetical protein Sradi_6834200 [Sesamum radiatum]|uniref:Uncharacterized protein n=1 Tax=Sesamum radiatum TaxID=300843 RepID=A0AAW2JLU7_SESRA
MVCDDTRAYPLQVPGSPCEDIFVPSKAVDYLTSDIFSHLGSYIHDLLRITKCELKGEEFLHGLDRGGVSLSDFGLGTGSFPCTFESSVFGGFSVLLFIPLLIASTEHLRAYKALAWASPTPTITGSLIFM